jgi:ATP-dependent DNA ligase
MSPPIFCVVIHLLLGQYTPDGKLIYAGRADTGMLVAELERLRPIYRQLCTPP